MAKVENYLLVRNALLNFIGQLAPLLIGVITIPYVIRGLGADRFGLLSLAWVLLGYFSVFDLGLGRATTKFIAEYLERGQTQELRPLLWTSIMLNISLGILGGLSLASLVPFLVDKAFHIPTALAGEAKSTFYVLVASLPIVLTSMALKAVLEAAQRFDLVNVVSVPTSALTYAIPAAVLTLGFGLPQIVFLLLLAKLGGALAYWVLCGKVFPALRKAPSLDTQAMRLLFTFGGWVTVSNIVGPIFVYLDRFLIGMLLSMAAVAYYTLPQEVVTRLGIVPASLVATLFPAFSSLGAANARLRLERIYILSVKYMLLLMGPLVLILIVFTQKILPLWLGSELAEESMLVFQILIVGVLVNSLALTPFNLIQGLGRPDITAKFHLIELPLYLTTAFFLVKTVGITGAALAWSLRMALDALLLFGVSGKLYSFSPFCFIQNGILRAVVALSILAGSLWMLQLRGNAIVSQIGVTIMLFTLFALAVWRYVLDVTEKDMFISIISQLASVAGGKG